MPLYEYRCTQCSYKFEKIQKFNAEPPAACPKCGGALERPLTAPALQFKGAGWYVNDYASKPASGTADKPPSEGSSSATESKPAAESKPATTESAPTTTPTSKASTTSS